MSVAAAVERDLRSMPAAVRESALAATARRMAEELDDPENSATSKSMCARVLVDAIDRLRQIAPPKEATDGVDEIAKQAAKRRARAAAEG